MGLGGWISEVSCQQLQHCSFLAISTGEGILQQLMILKQLLAILKLFDQVISSPWNAALQHQMSTHWRYSSKAAGPSIVRPTESNSSLISCSKCSHQYAYLTGEDLEQL